MRHKCNCVRRTARAFQTGNDVFDRARHFVARRNARGALDLRSEAKSCELRNEIVAHAVVLGGANRMRRGRESVQINERARCGENILRCGCALRLRYSLADRAHARDH